MVTIITVIDGKHIGDDNNAKGTAAALKRKYPDATTMEWNSVENVDVLKGLAAAAEGPIYIIGAGEQSLEPLAAMHGVAGVVTSWSGHMQFDSLTDEIIRQIDSIHLPSYEVPHTMRLKHREKLCLTPHGVPHNVAQGTFTRAYEEKKQSLPEAERYLAVVLGGDAPAAGGAPQYYSEEEAKLLGKEVAVQASEKRAVVIATNGPRTGKIDPETGKERPNNHQVGAPLDPVSAAFQEGLKQARLAEDQYCFYDFKFGSPSAYNAIMGAVAATPGSTVYLPGESTSMLTEGVENLKPGTIMAYDTGAMNEAHRKQVKSLEDALLVSTLKWKKPGVTSKMHLLYPHHTSPQPAAETVATHLERIAQVKMQPAQQRG